MIDLIKKLFLKISWYWAYLFHPRYIGVDYGSYDDEACVVWFKHKDKVYVTDYIGRSEVLEEEQNDNP